MTAVSYDYQWIRTNSRGADTDIRDATGSSYTVSEADLGKTIKVRVSFTDDAGSEESVKSAATVPVVEPKSGLLAGFTLVDASDQAVLATLSDGATLALADPANGSYGIRADTKSGAQIGSVRLQLTGAKSVDQTDGSAPYSLYGDRGENALNGGNLPVGAYTLTATAYSEGGLEILEMSFTVTGPAQEVQNSPATGAPTISGTAQVGQTLTASTDGIADQDGLPSVFAYQWKRYDADGNTFEAIIGHDSSTYTLAESEEGKRVKVEVAFTDSGGSNEGPLVSDAYPSSETVGAAGQGNTPPTSSNGTVSTDEDAGYVFAAADFSYSDSDGEPLASVKITGPPAAGKGHLAVDGAPVAAADLPQTVTATELADGMLTYTPPANRNGTGYSSFTFRVNDGTADSPEYTMTINVNLPATGRPTISGTLQLGETLIAETSGIGDYDGVRNVSYGYQWIRSDWNGDTDIQDATGASYTLVEADRGKTIRVRVSFADDAGNRESVISWPTGTVGLRLFKASVPNYPASHDGATTFTFELHFSDEPFYLKIREVENEIFTVRGGTIAKAWHLNPPSSIGWRIVVKPSGNADVRILLPASTHCRATGKVCATSNGWNFRPLSTEVRLTVPGPSSLTQTPTNAPPTGAPAISGTPHVGVTLEADTSGIGDDDGLINVAYNYQWIRAYGLGADTDIRDATGSSYTVLDADLGKTIKVRVSFTDDAGSEESVKSAATVPVVEPKSGLLAGFTLVDASDQAVLATLSDGATLALADPANGSYGIRADTKSGAQIGSVRLQLTGAKSVDQTDGFAPYSLYGDQGENALNGGNLPVGAYTLTATAYSEGGLEILEMSFTVTGPAQEVQNSPATGAPTISGTAQVGQTLTASTDGIADQDGLPSVFAYQWKRYDADGNTFEAIIGHDSSTYTLAESEEGKRVKVEVAFTDSGGSNEGPLVSDAYPSSETVGAAGQGNTPPTSSNGTVSTDEDAGYVFAAADFSYSDSDGEPLASVKITGPPAAGKGHLAVDGAPVAAADLPQTVTATELADGMLTYAPPANANGTGYSSFTFRVNDGTEDSPEYTMTINVSPVNDPATGAPTISGNPAGGGNSGGGDFGHQG